MKTLFAALTIVLGLVGYFSYQVYGEIVQNEDFLVRRLPNSCGISATEAYERLYATGVWCRMIGVFFVFPETGEVGGHMMTVWQPHGSKSILIYDESFFRATFELDPSVKRDANSIKDALNKLRDKHGPLIIGAHFIQP